MLNTYIMNVSATLARTRARAHTHTHTHMGQVALNWVICKGAIPIPGASSAAQIDDNLGALSQYTRFFSIRTCGYVMYIDSRMYHTLTPTLAVQRAGALGWRLTDSEVRTLEEAADALAFDFKGAGFQTTDSKFVGYGFERWRLD